MSVRNFEPHSPTAARLDPRTRALLEGPIAATLLKLAAPNVLVMFVQASVGLIETYFVGWLGTDALAGVALVFPLVMLMQMMSAGAMGGGISSAVARARSGAVAAPTPMRWGCMPSSSAASSGSSSWSQCSSAGPGSTALWAAMAPL